MKNITSEKDKAELAFWVQLYDGFVRGCSEKEKKDQKCLEVSKNITYPRYKKDLYLEDSSFEGKKVLDLGCGPNGGLIDFIGCEKYGADHLLDQYKEIGYPLDKHGIKYYDTKSENLPFEDSFFDIVVCVNALDHVDNLEITIKEISRVLKRGGSFLSQLNFRPSPALTEPIVFNKNSLEDLFLKYEMEITKIQFQYSIPSEDRFYYEARKKGKTILNEWENMVRLMCVSTVDLSKDFVYNGGIFIDAGANVGTFTEMMMDIKPKCQAYLFEPVKDYYLRCCEKFRNNPSIVVENLALGEKAESKTIYKGTFNLGDNTFEKDLIKDSVVPEITRSISFDDYCKQHNINDISLIKIDVEGNEYAVLKGMRKTILNSTIKPYIVIELGFGKKHTKWALVAEELKWLFSIGYKSFLKGKEFIMNLNINQFDTSTDILLIHKDSDYFSGLNKVSKQFVFIMEKYLSKEYHCLEFGSSTGHMSLFLGKKGYNIDLLDIREMPIEEAKEIFARNRLNRKFYIEDFLEHNIHYDFIFNSGLVQCLDDNKKDMLISHASSVAKRVLLFYPQRNDCIGPRDLSKIEGVDGCAEYPTASVDSIFKKYFNKVETGIISKGKTCTDFDFEWVYGEHV